MTKTQNERSSTGMDIVTSILLIGNMLYIKHIFNLGIRDDLLPYVYYESYLNNMGIVIITFLITLITSFSFIEKSEKEFQISINKMLVLFFVGFLTLTNLRDSHLENLKEMDIGKIGST